MAPEPAENVTHMERRSENKWLDPRFLAAALAIIVGLIGIEIGSRMTSNAQSTETKAAISQVLAATAKIESSQSRSEQTVQQMSNIVVSVQAKVEGMARELDDLKRAKEVHDAYLTNQGNRITKLEAKVEK